MVVKNLLTDGNRFAWVGWGRVPERPLGGVMVLSTDFPQSMRPRFWIRRQYVIWLAVGLLQISDLTYLQRPMRLLGTSQTVIHTVMVRRPPCPSPIPCLIAAV